MYSKVAVQDYKRQLCFNTAKTMLQIYAHVCQKVAKECEGIYYEEDTGYMSVMATYMMEVKIAKFIKNLAENNEVLDLDWQKYTTVKDGTLTTEQSNVLKDACENRIIIVDAGGWKW